MPCAIPGAREVAMTLLINDMGSCNSVDIAADVIETGNGMITLAGNDSRLTISSGSVLSGTSIHLGSNCRIDVDCTRLAASEIHCVAGASITIGHNCSFTWRTQVLAHEAGSIRIGAGCLLATETLVTLSDMHAILDMASGRRLNAARDVEIGDRVWIGFRAMVFKGVSIGEGSVIGAGAVVTGNIPPHCMAVGNPARVKREGIGWSAELK